MVELFILLAIMILLIFLNFKGKVNFTKNSALIGGCALYEIMSPFVEDSEKMIFVDN